MKLSEPMKRELRRIARASTGRGHRGTRHYGHMSTHRALERRGLIARTGSCYGRGVRFTTWLTSKGARTAKALGLLLVLLAFAVGCTQLSVTPDVTQPARPPTVEASTFGSGNMDITLGSDGAVTAEMDSDGTNVMSIFTGLFDAAARLFGGGGEAPTINITVPTTPEVNVTNPAQVAPTP